MENSRAESHSIMAVFNYDNKKAGHCARLFKPIYIRLFWQLGRNHFVGLQALLALHYLEADLLAFLQALEAVALNRAEMHENIRAIVTADEAETLGVVEPFDGTDLTIRHVAHSKLKFSKRLDHREMRQSAYWCAKENPRGER
jgi:hypothetical protein